MSTRQSEEQIKGQGRLQSKKDGCNTRGYYALKLWWRRYDSSSTSTCKLFLKYDIFSNRGKNPPEVYVYDEIPTSLRNQVILLWNEIESSVVFEPYDLSDAIVRILRMEYGTLQLSHANRAEGPHRELRAFFLMERDMERLLDALKCRFG